MELNLGSGVAMLALKRGEKKNLPIKNGLYMHINLSILFQLSVIFL